MFSRKIRLHFGKVETGAYVVYPDYWKESITHFYGLIFYRFHFGLTVFNNRTFIKKGTNQ